MLELRPHQNEALAALRQVSGNRALAVLACGTGKTLVGLHAALERMGPGGGLVMLLVPRKQLLRQTYQAWQREVPDLTGLLVYSDPGQGGADATTDPARIAQFMRDDVPGLRLLMCTYDSARRVAEAYKAEDGLPPVQVMILDEAHVTAGAAGRRNSLALYDKHVPASIRISLTATARVHPDADGTQDVVSMDNPELYGERAHDLTFGEAIHRKLLSDFRVAVVLVTDEEVHRVLLDQAALPGGVELSTSQAAAQVAVARAISEYGVRSLIAFHSRVDRSKAFTRSLSRTASAVTTVPVEALHLDASSTPEEREEALERLARPAQGGATVLSNVAVIGLGTDVPAADGVGFVDARSSRDSIVQAVGRALRLHPDHDRPSTIVLPVYLAPGENPEQVLEGSEFRHIWAVLSALRDFDERMDSAFSLARTQIGEQDFRDGESREHVLMPEALEILGADEGVHESLYEALTLSIVRGVTESWLERYGQLKRYLEFTGDLPKNSYVTPDGFSLGAFVAAQRQQNRKGTLLPARRDLLEKLPGWSWGKKKEVFPEFDQKALEEVARDWHRVLGESGGGSHEALAVARRCESIVPGFKLVMSKQRAWVAQAVSHMQYTMERVPKRRAQWWHELWNRVRSGEELPVERLLDAALECKKSFPGFEADIPDQPDEVRNAFATMRHTFENRGDAEELRKYLEFYRKVHDEGRAR